MKIQPWHYLGFIFICSFPSDTAFGEWVWRNPTPQGDLLNAVTYGRNEFVAVGVAGQVTRSPDGVNWLVKTCGLPGSLQGIAFGNGIYVTVGNDPSLGINQGFIAVSNDALTWGIVLDRQRRFGSVSFQNGTFFATSLGGVILASSDGKIWNEKRRDDSNTIPSAVTYGNGMFVALVQGRAITSPDGNNWMNGGLISLRSAPRAITYGNGVFVAVGDGQPDDGYYNVFTSLNAIHWTPRNTMSDDDFYSVAFGNGFFVAVGHTRTILHSRDAVTWTPIESVHRLQSVTHSGGQFLAVGDAGAILASPDGVTWASRLQGTRAWLQGIASSGSEYAAVGHLFSGNNYNGAVLTSKDGVKWAEKVLPETAGLNSIVSSKGSFFAVGENGHVLISSGDEWQKVNTGQTNSLRGITIGNDELVAVGDRRTILASKDGRSWTSRTASEENVTLKSIAYGNGLYVAVGYKELSTLNGLLLSSRDGIQWQSKDVRSAHPLFCVTYGEGRFVFGGASALYTSTDGLQWGIVQSGSGVYPRGLAFSDGIFVSVGEEGTIWRSDDGLTWSKDNSPTKNTLFAVSTGPEGLITVGDIGTVLQSVAAPLLQAPRISQSAFSFSINGRVGDKFQVQRSTNLPGANWTDYVQVVLTMENVTISDARIANTSQFYRVFKIP